MHTTWPCQSWNVTQLAIARTLNSWPASVPLDLAVLEDRYRSELRPYLAAAERHDLTIRLWIEMLSGQ
jgi:hypothetical protein